MIERRRREAGNLLHGSNAISFDKGGNRLLDVNMTENLENRSYLVLEDHEQAWEQTNQAGRWRSSTMAMGWAHDLAEREGGGSR